MLHPLQNFVKLSLLALFLIVAVPANAGTQLSSEIVDIMGTSYIQPIQDVVTCSSVATTTQLVKYWLNTASTTGNAVYGSSADCANNVIDYNDLIITIGAITNYPPGIYNVHICAPGNYAESCWQTSQYYMSLYWNGSTTIPYNENTATTTLGCQTCTRLVTPDPGYQEQLTATTTQYTSTNQFYVNSDDNPYVGTTYAKFDVIHGLTQEGQTFTQEVTTYDSIQDFVSNITLLTREGTYSASFEIYNDSIFYPRVTKYYVAWGFSVATTTPQEQIDDMLDSIFGPNGTGNYYGQDDSTYTQSVVERFLSTEVFGPIKSKVSEILRLPPWGYVFHFYDLLLNPATTTLPVIHIAFNQYSPAYGKTLDLNPATGLTEGLLKISEVDVETIDGDPMTKFLEYWDILWYLMFAMWLMHELIGGFTTSETPEAKHRKGDVNMRVTNKYGTKDVNMK